LYNLFFLFKHILILSLLLKGGSLEEMEMHWAIAELVTDALNDWEFDGATLEAKILNETFLIGNQQL
jgi:hypothetical protein